jgi:PadR family transcriptional regulator PadR
MRRSIATSQGLQAFRDAPSKKTYGYELARATDLASGTIYPILRRLEDRGWVTSDWEEVDDPGGTVRRRRYYRLTGEGARAAREATAHQSVALRALNPGWATT